MKIDIVYSVVLSNDPVWKNKIEFYRKKYNIEKLNPDRYNFNYEINISLYLLQINLEWINNIYIITDNQKFNVDFLTPTFRKKIKFIDHKDIIPKNFLPTFNSRTIETFIWKIPDLSNYYLYMNDDFFICKRYYLSDIFNRNGKLIINVKKYRYNPNISFHNKFKWLIPEYNAYKLLTTHEDKKITYVSSIIHAPYKFNKNLCKIVYNKYKKYIDPHLTPFRDDILNKGNINFNALTYMYSIAHNFVQYENIKDIQIYQSFGDNELKLFKKKIPLFLNINLIKQDQTKNLVKILEIVKKYVLTNAEINDQFS